ncbi:MAG: Holliday junction resolvase RuvX [Candidatus Nomurabacteria bacterium]|nr:Holliday junction resolvase RuvX [Candidatus Nomurabacteria bacterium]
MKYLGIDYGTKRIGLATSDDSGRMAFPHSVISSDGALESIEKIIETEGIGEIVMGHSKTTGGEDNVVMGDIRDLMGQMSLTIGLPIHLIDERFSSHSARADFAPEKNVSRSRKVTDKQKKDDSAAAIILQRYLDKQ